MSRSAGTYTLPSNTVSPAVADTVISPTDFNEVMDDLETAVNESTYTAGLGSTDNRLVRTDGTDTKKIQGSAVTVDDSGNMSGVSALSSTTIELGHASDTTIARSGAGDITIEGNAVYRAGGADVALADGGTGASLSDPNADRLMFWDDSGGAVTWLSAGAGLTISGTTITTTSGRVFNVMDAAYGAVNDNSTNDYTAVAAAVAACKAAGGGIVYFPPGAGYYIASAVTIDFSNCVLMGGGMGRTSYIRFPDAVNGFVFSHATPSTNSLSDIGIHNLTIWGPSAPTSGIGITFTRCNRVYVSNLDLRAFFQGMKIEGGVEQFYNNMTIGGAVWVGAAANSYLLKIMKHAGATETPSEVFISNFNIKGSSGTPYLENGIVLEACDGLWLSNGHGGFASNAGLQILGTGADTSIVNIDLANVMFDGNAGDGGYGIRTGGTSGGTLRELKFTGCTFVGHDNHGVELGLAAMSRVNFTGCKFSSNENWGLKIDAGTGYVIGSCTFYDNNSAAGSEGDISLDGVTNVVVNGNTFEAGASAQAYGVLIGSGSNDQISIVNNSFVGCTTDIQVNSTVDDLRLENNPTSKSDTIASANPLVIPNAGDNFHVSGTTNFSTISAPSAIGREVTLIFDGVLTVSSGASLAVASNFTTAAGYALKLINDGTIWREVSRSPGASGSGDVVGPASSTDNAIVRFDGTTGKLVQNNTQVTIADTGAITQAIGTVTVSTPSTFSQTMNDAAVTFIGHSFEYTDTASAGGSTVFRVRVGGSNQLSVEKSAGAWILGLNGFTATSTAITAANSRDLSFTGTAAGRVMWNSDTFLSRSAAATLQLGAADAATPVAQTLRAQGSRSGTDSNVGGGNLTIQSGTGTGTGTASSLILRSPVTVASGTGAQTQTTGLTITSGIPYVPSYTVAGAPSAATAAGIIYVSNESGGAVLAFSDGTNWRRVTDRAIIS